MAVLGCVCCQAGTSSPSTSNYPLHSIVQQNDTSKGAPASNSTNNTQTATVSHDDVITVVNDRHNERDQSPSTRARSAALTGDKRSMQRLLQHEDWLLNSRDNFGRTLPMYAVMCDHDKYLRWLQKRGAQLWDVDSRGRSVLHWAVIKDSRSCLKYLLSSQARRHATTRSRHSVSPSRTCFTGDMDSCTPLHLAMRQPEPDCISIILRRLKPADQHVAKQTDVHGRNVLHYAAAFGHADHLRMVLAAFARGKLAGLPECLNAMDSSGRTPLMWAISNANKNGVSCVQQLLQVSPMSAHQTDGQLGLSLLHLTAITNARDVLPLLLRSRSPSNKKSVTLPPTNNGHYVAGDDEKERWLNVNARDNDQRTPLHWAARIGHVSMVKHLLEYGANLNARDCDGALALHHAAAAGHVEVLKVLLKHHKGKDHADSSGRTSFMWAVWHDQLTVVQYMLTQNSSQNRDQRDRVGASALHLAADLGRFEIMNLLLQNGWHVTATTIDGSTALMLAARRGHSRVVKSLLSAGADVAAADLQGRTATHWCCLGGHAFICQQLAEQFAFDANIQDVAGRTALHSAAFAGHLGCASTLIQAGADMCVRDHQGYSPLHMAAARGNADVTELLLESHCPVNILCHDVDLNESFTPMDCAREANQESIIPLLQVWGAMGYQQLSALAATIIQATFRGFSTRRKLMGTSLRPTHSRHNTDVSSSVEPDVSYSPLDYSDQSFAASSTYDTEKSRSAHEESSSHGLVKRRVHMQQQQQQECVSSATATAAQPITSPLPTLPNDMTTSTPITCAQSILSNSTSMNSNYMMYPPVSLPSRTSSDTVVTVAAIVHDDSHPATLIDRF